MVGSSKILTVSYGTFSCTLEGFDDSFDTMKAIAEYFRDLAADDRYFGAEPPTPDAEMLARIAEREIARRVEAHEERGRIVLKAQDARSLAGLAVPQPPAPEAPRAETETAEPLRPEGIETEEEMSRAAVFAEETPPAEPVADVPAVESAQPVWEKDWQATAEVAAPAEAQSLAAKLDLIRSVVGGEEQYNEDEHAQDFVEPEAPEERAWDAPEDLAKPDEASSAPEEADEPDDALAAAPGGMPSADMEDDTFLDAAEEMAATSEEVAEAPDSVTEAADAAPLSEHAVEDTEAAAETPDQAPMPEEIEEVEETAASEATSFEDTLAALMADATPEPHRAAQGAAPVMKEAEDETPEAAARLDEEAAPDQKASLAGRVLKVKRADFESAQAEGLIEEAAEIDAAEEDWDDTEDTDDAAGNIFGEDDSALSPEEEADLQRELAELEAELQDDEWQEETSAPQAEAEKAAAPALARDTAKPQRAGLGDVADEAALSRIFEQTDSQMATPESSKRRNTIQHLRAALAATRAEKEAGADLNTKVDESPYRGDLAAAVRPRRPEALGTRSARPEEPRPAPLKLVAEQRVDVGRSPVRPRRVAAPQPEVLAPQDGGFSDFAEEMGATALPDLLEAAAAYLADVEGRAQFSRPMLMGKLREVDEEGFSREDGLRSFGQLLREGKLQKLSGGRFAVTEETEFRAAAKRRAS